MVNISDYKKQIYITKAVHTVLKDYKEDNPELYHKFSQWFHLRPGSANITIVTTHPCRPMRGIHIGYTKVKDTVSFLADCIENDSNIIDWDRIASKYNAGKGFEEGFTNNEFPYQAKMINSLHNNKKLMELLNVQNLFFTASEIVFARSKDSRKKIDIVAHNGAGKVFFFEMKAPENDKDDPVKQVKAYLNLYGKKGEKNELFEKMMAVYPQNPIYDINDYIGYGIIGYGKSTILKQHMLIDCR